MLKSKQLLAFVIGALLLVVYGAGIALQGEKVSETPLENKNDASSEKTGFVPNEKNATVLIEPGLFQLIIPERFNYPPEENSQVIKNGELSAPFTFYRYQSNDKQSIYEVSFIRLPRELFEQKSKPEIFADLRDGELARLNGELQRESTSYTSPTSIRQDLEIVGFVDTDELPFKLYTHTAIVLASPYAIIQSFSSKDQAKLTSKEKKVFFESFKLYEDKTSSTVRIASKGAQEDRQLAQPNDFAPTR